MATVSALAYTPIDHPDEIIDRNLSAVAASIGRLAAGKAPVFTPAMHREEIVNRVFFGVTAALRKRASASSVALSTPRHPTDDILNRNVERIRQALA